MTGHVGPAGQLKPHCPRPMLPALQGKGAWEACMGPLGERQGERGCSETQRWGATAPLPLGPMSLPAFFPGASQARPSPIVSLHEVPRLLGAILEETGQRSGSAPGTEEAPGTHCSSSSQGDQLWPRPPGSQEVQQVGRGVQGSRMLPRSDEKTGSKQWGAVETLAVTQTGKDHGVWRAPGWGLPSEWSRDQVVTAEAPLGAWTKGHGRAWGGAQEQLGGVPAPGRSLPRRWDDSGA